MLKLRPRPLEKGDTVALVAPAGCFDSEALHRSITMLEQHGYRPVHSQVVHSCFGEMAGQDWMRTEDLIQQWKNQETTAIWCIRGGYGSGRILPHLPPSIFTEHEKIFIGYSDITYLHMFILANSKTVVFHGPNLLELDSASDANVYKILTFLEGKQPFSWTFTPSQVLCPGVASGRLLGGNLTCLTHLLGTTYIPKNFWNGAILFLEDRGEAGYRIDRMFTHLKHAGIFQNICGLILGSFTKCEDLERLTQRVMDILEPYNFPVVYNLPFGHSISQDILPLGPEYIINTHDNILAIKEKPFTTTLPQ